MKKTRLHGLDHLRALAILLVLLFHYHFYYGVPKWLIGISSFGWSGVDLFFVLSGYLIGDMLLNRIDHSGRVGFRRFYTNRFLRIIPAYAVVIFIYFFFQEAQEGRSLQPAWRFLTFTQNIPIDLRANSFSHAWSLCVEEHFYLLLPFVLWLIYSLRFSKKAVYIFIAFFAFGLLVRYLSWVSFVNPLPEYLKLRAALKTIYYPTYTRLDGLIVGVMIASIFRNRPRIRNQLTRHGNIVLIFGLALLAASYLLFGGNILSKELYTLKTSLFGFPLISIAYGTIVVAALSPSCVLYKVKSRTTKSIAVLSFSLYLIHKITNHLVNTQIAVYFELSNVQIFIVCLAAAFAGAIALHLLVEKPFLILRDRINSRPRKFD